MSISSISGSAGLLSRPASAGDSSGAGAAGKPSSAPPPIALQSPVYKIDYPSNIPVEIFRDKQTGAVTNQIPSEQVVKKYELGQMQGQNPGSAQGAQSPRPGQTAASPVAGGAAAVDASGRTGTGRSSALASTPGAVSATAVAAAGSPAVAVAPGAAAVPAAAAVEKSK